MNAKRGANRQRGGYRGNGRSSGAQRQSAPQERDNGCDVMANREATRSTEYREDMIASSSSNTSAVQSAQCGGDSLLAQQLSSQLTLNRQLANRKSRVSGKPIELYTNHFPITIDAEYNIVYLYDIEIEKEEQNNGRGDANDANNNRNYGTNKMSSKLTHIVMRQLIDENSRSGADLFGIAVVYDGKKNVYSSKQIDPNSALLKQPILIAITDNDRTRHFVANMQFTKRIDLSALALPNANPNHYKEAILFLDIMLRYLPSQQMNAIAQSLFKPYNISDPYRDGHYESLTPFVDLAFGTYMSVRKGENITTLNVDISSKLFHKPLSLIEFIKRLFQIQVDANTALRDADRVRLRNELKGVNIMTNYNNRKYFVNGISPENANQHKFHWTENMEKNGQLYAVDKEVSVYQYMREKYKINLKYPLLPCIEVRCSNRLVNLPLECCQIVADQRVNRKLKDKEKSDMTKNSSLKPFERFNLLHTLFMNIMKINQHLLPQFGVKIGTEFLVVKANLISAPKLQYNNKVIDPRNGKWNQIQAKAEFLEPILLSRWLVVDISDEKNLDIKSFLDQLKSCALNLGMNSERLIFKNYGACIYKPNDNVIAHIFEKAKQLEGLQLILFILPDKFGRNPYKKEIREKIKLIGDCLVGLKTQCVSAHQMKKVMTQSINNLCLKINTKLGGTNQCLYVLPNNFANKNLMIFGADVNHPGVGDNASPSIAAVVANYDSNLCKYIARIRLQTRREEVIRNMEEMVSELMEVYIKTNKSKTPDSVLFYRDGVSEGQFEIVVRDELPLIKRALSKFAPKAKLTFIIVGKRHNNKFILKDFREDDNESQQNMAAGTVIDTSITNPYYFDMFLCSHEGMKGTSRAPHITMLSDENNLTADDIAIITNYLCYVYSRSTKAVSIPAPIYYAHWAAYRTKEHINGWNDERFGDHSVASGDTAVMNDIDDYIRQLPPEIISPKLENNSYFL